MDIKTIIFWIAIVIVAWFALRHLIAIIIGVSRTGTLKSGQRLCHAISFLLLCGGCITTIYYRIWWPLVVGLIVELLFRKSVIHSGDTVPFNTALKQLLLYHEACMLFIANWEYADKEKAELATHLYFLGAIDCSSQRHNLSDIQFANLITAFFQAVKAKEMYAMFMGVFFLKMNSVPSAMKCVIEGGEHFNRWLNGNSSIPMCSVTALEEFCEDPDFPASVGHLYVKVEKP